MLSKRTGRVLVLIPAAAAALVATSACGAVTAAPPTQAAVEAGYAQAGNGTGTGNIAAAPPTAAPPDAETPAADVPAVEPTNDSANRMLSAFASAQLGTVVVNAHGFAVYRFDKDTTKPSKSNCEGECAKTWPPVLATNRTMVSELDAALVGQVARADGKLQVTFAGSPLYTYTGDRAPGRTSGQGKGGTWWAVTPTGAKAAGTAGTGTPPSSAPASGPGTEN
ncbi:hypothetical protein [Umezawaea sp.]|uniref:COG4315 family predicted lipoprotein n=1 Tax=Umezawaea sp. TaxID=1955258 RepID=UPI002ED39B4C